MNIKLILNNENINLKDLILCDDFISSYKTKNLELISFFENNSNINNLIDLLLNSNDIKIMKIILEIFLMTTNNIVSITLSQDPKLSEKIFTFLYKFSNSSSPIYSIVNQIFSFVFQNWNSEMFLIFNNSLKIYFILILLMNYLPIYNFINTVLIKSINSKPFIWYLYKCLMDEHGVGLNPKYIEINFKNIRLNYIQRLKSLELISSFMNTFKEELELSNIISYSLPLLLTDSSTSKEISLVFNLAINLEKNEYIIFSAITYLTSFTSLDYVLLKIMRFLIRFKVSLSTFIIQKFLFRFLQLKPSNIFIPVALQLLTFSNFNSNEFNHFNKYLFYVYNHHNNLKHIQLFILSIFSLIEHKVFDYTSSDFLQYYQDLSNILKDPFNYQFNDLKKLLIDDSNPIFDASKLWGDKLDEFSIHFKYIHKLNHLNKYKLINDDSSIIFNNQQENHFPNQKRTNSGDINDINNDKFQSIKAPTTPPHNNHPPRSISSPHSKAKKSINDFNDNKKKLILCNLNNFEILEKNFENINIQNEIKEEIYFNKEINTDISKKNPLFVENFDLFSDKQKETIPQLKKPLQNNLNFKSSTFPSIGNLNIKKNSSKNLSPTVSDENKSPFIIKNKEEELFIKDNSIIPILKFKKKISENDNLISIPRKINDNQEEFRSKINLKILSNDLNE